MEAARLRRYRHTIIQYLGRYCLSLRRAFMCQGDAVQWQASSHRLDQTVALEERAELGKAGVAIGSSEIVDEKKAEA